ncbi:MAG TPA: polymer-forming cytoskeletal protein [Terriglobales bacterium]|nr:polymer-forming cytoskeletal protein [Terriglobales bacterium]
MDAPKTGDFAHIGKSVVIKGELSGSEDLYVDGQVTGSIELRGNSLTVGPNGQVKANVSAKTVVVQGRVEGNVQAADRVDLRKSAVMLGDLFTQRIAIEDGAYLKGKVDIQKEGAKPEMKPATSPAVAPTTPAAAPATAVSTAASTAVGTVATPQGSFEQKK